MHINFILLKRFSCRSGQNWNGKNIMHELFEHRLEGFSIKLVFWIFDLWIFVVFFWKIVELETFCNYFASEIVLLIISSFKIAFQYFWMELIECNWWVRSWKFSCLEVIWLMNSSQFFLQLLKARICRKVALIFDLNLDDSDAKRIELVSLKATKNT